MTGTEAIDYLGLLDGERRANIRDRQLAVIEFAYDRGWYAGVWNEWTIETATARSAGLNGYDEYEGDLDADLAYVTSEAVQYLNETGLLPEGYGPDEPHHDDGYGLLPTDGEGS